MQHRHLLGQHLEQVDGSHHHDGLVEVGGQGRVHRPAHQRHAAHLAQQLVALPREALPGPRSQHNGSHSKAAVLAVLFLAVLFGHHASLPARGTSNTKNRPGQVQPVASDTSAGCAA